MILAELLAVHLLAVLLQPQGTFLFKCLPGNLAVYSIKLKTYWSEQSFPKQYPQWRPPAQWSKTVGLVHQEGLNLYRVGEEVSKGVREFVETGHSEILEQEIGNRSASTLDTILLPQILQGVGESRATIFVDGNHTKVSCLTKIVPSPDWFVGLDSVELCKNGHFVDDIAMKVDPLDGGTDNGFTFTSPNWPTEPQAVVFGISHNYPVHPAGSFNYPHLDRLPTIAQYFITKEREYELTGGIKNKKEKIQGFISAQKLVHQPSKHTKQVEDPKEKYKYSIPEQTSQKSKNEIIDFVPYKSDGGNYNVKTNQVVSNNKVVEKPGFKHATSISGFSSKSGFRGGYHASSAPQDFLKKRYKSEYLSKAEDVIFPSLLDKKSKKKNNVLENILNSYKSKDAIRKKRRRFRKRKHHKKPRSCEVSSWIQWSACSKSCGIGEAVRTRTIIKHPRHGGTPCPKLRDYKWCGSARNCNSGYFNW